jgi:hypothetical protein
MTNEQIAKGVATKEKTQGRAADYSDAHEQWCGAESARGAREQEATTDG